MAIEVANIYKTFNHYRALRGVNLSVKPGEFVALLGPSGSGKTTLLRIIAGLEYPEDGDIFFAGENVVNRTVRERGVGFVFQHYALFRHMTVFDNIAFGLRVKPRNVRPTNDEITERVMHLLKLVQIEWLADHYPTQLSGGQRQRVALARALAIQPELLLLDEPFGALDAKVRMELRRWLRKLHDEMGLTSIFVTHDQEEAMEMADRVVVMNEGVIVQEGTPKEVYHTPATPFVYEFLGKINKFIVKIQRGKVNLGGCMLDAPDHQDADNLEGIVYVRPHNITVYPQGYKIDGIPAVVRFVSTIGPVVSVEVEAKGIAQPIIVEIPHLVADELELNADQPVMLHLRDYRVFA